MLDALVCARISSSIRTKTKAAPDEYKPADKVTQLNQNILGGPDPHLRTHKIYNDTECQNLYHRNRSSGESGSHTERSWSIKRKRRLLEHNGTSHHLCW